MAVVGAQLLAANSNKDASAGLPLTGDISPVHDPAVIRHDNTYYLYSTSHVKDGKGLIHIRTSQDLVRWERKGAVFATLFDWMKKEVPGVSGIWAPDISFANGRFRLYYSLSTFGSNHSAIGLASNATLDPASNKYQWRDEGVVIRSRPTDQFNAIDPNHVIDRNGHHWLAFGSFWSGLKMISVDPATGKQSVSDKRVYSIASRPAPGAVEAPFIIARGEYYYLFASYDFCCKGAQSTYYTVVGRSKQITGPYLDKRGKPMLGGGGSVVLHTSLDPSGRWRGPGHVSMAHKAGRDYILYHAYDTRNKARSTLRVQAIAWTGSGWPVTLQQVIG